ncbi:2-oxoacid:acceptor oxidoreductase family protein [bacterium]|nr:2-oxoacid:acceptor oxidoreductase family protein [bacterium]
MQERNFVIAGFGGQGVLLAGEVLANAFMLEDKNVTWYPCYGAEMRGGTVNCEIVMSNDEVSSVNKAEADFIIVLNQASFDKFESKVRKGGYLIVNTSLAEEKRNRSDIEYIFAPISQMAEDLGNGKMANMLSLGLLSRVSKLLSVDILEKALDNVLPPHRKKLLPMNKIAMEMGYKYDLLPINC